MSHDARDEKTRKKKKRNLKTRRFAEEEDENEKSLTVHPSGIQMLQKLRAKKTKVCVQSFCICLRCDAIHSTDDINNDDDARRMPYMEQDRELLVMTILQQYHRRHKSLVRFKHPLVKNRLMRLLKSKRTRICALID